jgi:signal transduction histidine kinase
MMFEAEAKRRVRPRALRLLQLFTAAAAFTASAWALLWFAWGVPTLGTILIVAAVLYPAVFLTYRWLGTEVAGHLEVGVLYGTLLLFVINSGGMNSPLASWFLLLPIITALPLGVGACAAWGALFLGTGAALWTLQLRGVEIRDLVPPELELQVDMISGLSLMGLMLIMALAYAHLSHHALRRLRRANQELRESQARLVLSEKLAALGRVTAGIAHEINSPLGATFNAVELARGYALEYRESIGDASVTEDDHRAIAADLLGALALAESAASRAGAFVRSIKMQTRAEAVTTEQRLELASEIRTIIALLGHERPELDVRCELARGLVVAGDPHRLALVVRNLVVNALDSYGETTAARPVWLRTFAAADHAVLEVEDHGDGIPAAIRSRVFDYLFTTKEVGRGTGLGLSMAHNVVTSHFRGSIDFDSEVGRGTIFRVRLPLAD